MDIFGDIGGKPGKEHRVKFIDIDAMADGGSRDDIAQAFPERRKWLAGRDAPFGALHDILYLRDGDAAGDKLGYKREFADAFAALIALDLRLQASR